MKKILIVDDESVVLDVLERILARLGCMTAVAHTGEKALELFAGSVFDLVMLDVLMPGRNGFEIAEEMRKIRPHQKIVLVTGMGEHAASIRSDTCSVQVDDILAKPFSFEKIKHVVEETEG